VTISHGYQSMRIMHRFYKNKILIEAKKSGKGQNRTEIVTLVLINRVFYLSNFGFLLLFVFFLAFLYTHPFFLFLAYITYVNICTSSTSLDCFCIVSFPSFSIKTDFESFEVPPSRALEPVF
jgi:hypothetical protein